MRVYVPATLSGLARLAERREHGPAPLDAYAVTPRLRAWHGDGDDEELEFEALTEAARDSLRRLAAGGAQDAEPARRVVIAAEIPPGAVLAAADGAPGLVRIDRAIALSDVAAFHLDDHAAAEDVAAAAKASAAADAGDAAAQLTVEALDDHDLLWFASQELDDLLG
jgi:hypothetical protein